MDKPHCKRLLYACIIVITLLCTFLINAEFIAAHYSEYHNLLNESSFEPVDMEKITLQKEEVEAVEWFDLEEIHEACLTRNPRFCVPIEGLKTLMKYLNLPVSC